MQHGVNYFELTTKETKTLGPSWDNHGVSGAWSCTFLVQDLIFSTLGWFLVISHLLRIISESKRVIRYTPKKCGFKHAQKQHWTMKSATKNYQLVADYIPASHEND